MTEDEAKGKWCPFARAIVANDRFQSPTHNRFVSETKGVRTDADAPPYSRCIGSACMAWRWATVANPDWKPQNHMTFPAPNPYSQPSSGVPSKTDGRCGLAGSQ